MRKATIIVIAIIMVCSCEHRNDFKSIEEYVFPERVGVWEKIEVPGADIVKAVEGNVDDTLIVMSSYGIYYLTNKGKSYKQSMESKFGLSTLETINDTLFAFEGVITKVINDVPEVSNADYGLHPHWYSTDKGFSWNENNLRKHYNINPPINIKYNAQSDISFIIKNIYQQEGGVNTNVIDHHVILRKTGDRYSRIDFPFKTYIENLYIDDNNRLYVCLGYAWKLYNSNKLSQAHHSGIIYMTELSNL